MIKRIYLTTSVPYVNAAPHIGHALEFVQSDCLARFYRAIGYDVYFSSGADENSLKNVQAAEKENIPVQQLVDKYAKEFENLKEALNLTFDVFNRTSSKEHYLGAQKIWSLCKSEDIYKKKYKGLYCVGCEQFYTTGELVDGKCPEHLTVPEEVEEENYFFRLSNYQKFLEGLIERDKLHIVPQSKKNEITSFIKGGLEDFSISRSVKRARGWGVPVPGEDLPLSAKATEGKQVMYVWFDALVTYLTALGYPDGDLYKKYWEANPNRVHIVGKGINRFHTIYWPAMLKSSGIPLPTEVFVHGYITVDGQKISKTLGNGVDPFDLVGKYGAEVMRFYLLREIPAWGDGDFSETRLKELYNGELANGIGNLVARVARLAADVNLKLSDRKNYTFYKEVIEQIGAYRFDLAFGAIWDEISKLDKLINEQKPWELEGKELKAVILPIAENIRDIAFNLSPFVPETSALILKQFTGEITAQKPLFPRLH